MQRFYSGILGEPANDVVQGGLLDVAHGGQLIDGNAALFAELADALYIEIRVFHDVPHIVFTRLRVTTMITAQREAITRIRVDKENNARYNYGVTHIRVNAEVIVSQVAHSLDTEIVLIRFTQPFGATLTV